MDRYKDSAAHEARDRQLRTLDGQAGTPVASPAAAEPTWEMVEDYFPGSECNSCDYLRVYRNCEGRFISCGLVKLWRGLGREPLPSDCRGVVKQMEEIE